MKIKPRNVIYQRVQEMIWDSNKSLVKIAREIGVHPSTVSSWQTMERTISVEALARLCEYTRTNPAWVLGLSERREM